MATIKDVAMDAGVSVGTGIQMSHGGKVSEERRQRGREVDSIGLSGEWDRAEDAYSAPTMSLSFCLNIINPFYSLLLQGLEHALSAYDKQPLLCIWTARKKEDQIYRNGQSQ